MADIFRKKALEKLSSPEQLDKMIVINSPMTWLALIGGALILAGALIWGIFGRIPITEEGSGILLRDGELTSIYAGTQGVVVRSYVSSGDVVKKGDVLFEVDSDEISAMAEDLEERIERVEAVTFDSSGDTVTSDNQPLMDIKNQVPSVHLESNAYQAQHEELNRQYEAAEEEASDLKKEMEEAKAAYEADPMNSQKAAAAELAVSRYEAAKAAVDSLKSQTDIAKSQAESGRDAAEAQGGMLRQQFDSTKAAIIDGLQQELEQCYDLQDGQEIKAEADGTVFSTFVSNGNPVAIDTEVARINETAEDGKMQAVYFMHITNGKKIKEGMKVNIYPTTLPKEEYGHMTGTVTGVADFVTSYSDLQARVGDMTLTETFAGSGPVVEVICDIDTDENTVSGFAWTSKKGETMEISGGTMLGGSLVIEEVAPISMLIPKLKEKFNAQIEPESENGKEESK